MSESGRYVNLLAHVLIHLSDRGVQHVSIPYTERLADLDDVLRSTRELDQGGRAQRDESPVSPGDST